MCLTNVAADDLRILPTHCLLLERPKGGTVADLIRDLGTYFVVTPKEDASNMPEIIAVKQWAFELYAVGQAYELRLRFEVHAQLDWLTTPEVKALGLTVLHYFISQQLLVVMGAMPSGLVRA